MSIELDKHDWADVFEVLGVGIVVIEDDLSGWEDIDLNEVEDKQDRKNIVRWRAQLKSARKAQMWIIENLNQEDT